MGKGDTYRPVDRKQYGINYLRIYGEKCWNCKGKGQFSINKGQVITICKRCNGVGYIERKNNDTQCPNCHSNNWYFTDYMEN